MRISSRVLRWTLDPVSGRVTQVNVRWLADYSSVTLPIFLCDVLINLTKDIF